MEQMSEAKLTIQIDNKKAIEITDFTDSFKALGNEYYKFLSENPNYKLNKDAKLYIKEIKTGSIITVLTDLTPIAIPFIEHSVAVIAFANYLKYGFDYFLGKSEKIQNYDLKDCTNFNDIIKPIAKDNGSNIVFTGDCNIETQTINYFYNSIEANAIQNGIVKERLALKETQISDLREKVIMAFFQTRSNIGSEKGNKVIIDDIQKGISTNVFFVNEELKKTILKGEENPNNYLYLVDVKIETVSEKIVAYRVLKLHETLPIE